jgi:ABC-type nitrate/sulfonate/bicarbonate transport system permease component
MKHLRDAVVRWGALVVLIGMWQLFAVRAHALFFPPPSAIAAQLVALWLSGPPNHFFLTPAVAHDVVPSLVRIALGWAIAAITGVAAGIVVGRSKVISRLVNPVLQFLRSTPGPALIPVFLVMLGTGSTMRVALIAFGSVWPVLLNTIDGVQSVDVVQLETARAFGLPLGARLRHVVLPAAMPRIFAGLRIALSLAIILMVVSEFVASTDGLGHAIFAAENAYLLPDMWAGIVLVGILGCGLNALFVAIDYRALFWYRGARQRERA